MDFNSHKDVVVHGIIKHYQFVNKFPSSQNDFLFCNSCLHIGCTFSLQFVFMHWNSQGFEWRTTIVIVIKIGTCSLHSACTLWCTLHKLHLSTSPQKGVNAMHGDTSNRIKLKITGKFLCSHMQGGFLCTGGKYQMN